MKIELSLFVYRSKNIVQCFSPSAVSHESFIRKHQKLWLIRLVNISFNVIILANTLILELIFASCECTAPIEALLVDALFIIAYLMQFHC